MKLIKNALKKSFLYPLYIKTKSWQSEVNRLDKRRGPSIDKYLPKGGIGAELGVFKGHFSKVLLNRTKPKQLHLIDPWYFLEANWLWASGNKSTVDALCNVLQYNKKEINEKVIFVHVQDDIKVLKDFPDEHFDWVYIDSSHAYDHTVTELELLTKKVKSSGIICGHDWQPDVNHRHHGVYKAVNEFLVKNSYKLIYADDESFQWFIKKRTDYLNK